MTNSLEPLIKRVKSLGDIPPLDISIINNLEDKLDICFPNDFKEISKLFRYDYLSNLNFFSPETEDDYSVIETTLRWRKTLSLPRRYVVLAEDSTYAILMETQPTPERPTLVTWCTIEDIDNIIKESELKYNPTVFSSFSNFFNYLVAEEENTLQTKKF